MTFVSATAASDYYQRNRKAQQQAMNPWPVVRSVDEALREVSRAD